MPSCLFVCLCIGFSLEVKWQVCQKELAQFISWFGTWTKYIFTSSKALQIVSPTRSTAHRIFEFADTEPNSSIWQWFDAFRSLFQLLSVFRLPCVSVIMCSGHCWLGEGIPCNVHPSVKQLLPGSHQCGACLRLSVQWPTELKHCGVWHLSQDTSHDVQFPIHADQNGHMSASNREVWFKWKVFGKHLQEFKIWLLW